MAQLRRLLHVNSFRDRHGRVRHYFRQRGRKALALPGIPGSAEFMAAYQVALADTPIKIGAERTVTGSVNAAIANYYSSEAFNDGLAPATQRMRRNILERFRNAHGDKRLALLERRHIVQLLEGMKPHARKNWLKTLRGLMAFAVINNLRADDPTAQVKIKAPSSSGHMTWHEPQIAQYRDRHPVGTMARLALELLLNIAARRGDAHLLGYQHISARKSLLLP
jgi:integrase/recombinase XerD